MNEIEEQAVIRKYLLGYSDADIAESIEQRLVGNSEYLQEFLIVTDELIEDYLDGSLSEPDVTRFETHFLTTPHRHRRLEMAKALSERAMSDVNSDTKTTDHNKNVARITPLPLPTHRRQYWQLAAAVTVVVFAGLIASTILRNRSPAGELQAELGRLNGPGSEGPAGPLVQLTIAPTTVRGLGEDRRVVVEPDTQTVVVRLVLADKMYDSYQAALQTVEGNELGKTPPLKPISGDEGRFIEVRLPAKRLESQNYQIKLSGLTAPNTYEDVRVYPFQIIKR
ncbi:MAG TPA: hypothetical protein VF088_14145 [Pyrinomonadaceae bacterium]